jgi:hypothetical protein
LNYTRWRVFRSIRSLAHYQLYILLLLFMFIAIIPY